MVMKKQIPSPIVEGFVRAVVSASPSLMFILRNWHDHWNDQIYLVSVSLVFVSVRHRNQMSDVCKSFNIAHAI